MSLKPFFKNLDETLISYEKKAKEIYKKLKKNKKLFLMLEESEQFFLLFHISILANMDYNKVLILTSKGENFLSIFNNYTSDLLLPYTVKYAKDKESLIAYLNTLPPNIILTDSFNLLKIFQDFEAIYQREYFSCELGLLIVNEKARDNYIIPALTLCLSSISLSSLYILDVINTKIEENIPDQTKYRFLLLSLINSERKIWQLDEIKNIWGEKILEFLRAHRKIEFYDDKFQIVDKNELIQEYKNLKQE